MAAWSYETLASLTELANDPKSGVVLATGVGAQHSQYEDDWWVSKHINAVVVKELPQEYSRAWKFCVPIVDMPIYLQFLLKSFHELGGQLKYEHVDNLESAALRSYDHIVVAAGLGSRDLADDPKLEPSRGQLVVVENPGVHQFFSERGDGPDLTYILPQGKQVVLGGTAECDSTSLEPDLNIAKSIIDRCSRVVPSLRTARILQHRVGLRPCREEVRLDHTVVNGRHIVHNYGHGGSGVSLSWGCAKSALRLILTCRTT